MALVHDAFSGSCLTDKVCWDVCVGNGALYICLMRSVGHAWRAVRRLEDAHWRCSGWCRGSSGFPRLDWVGSSSWRWEFLHVRDCYSCLSLSLAPPRDMTWVGSSELMSPQMTTRGTPWCRPLRH